MYLVVARCLTEDIPLALFPEEAGAIYYGKTVSYSEVIAVARELGISDATNLIAISVSHFRSGVPCGEYETVQEFTDAEDRRECGGEG